MRKLLICLLVLSVFGGVSCASAPAEIKPVAEIELTQQNIDDALQNVYDTYLPMLDMSNAQDYTVRWGDTLSKITRRYYGSLTGVGEAGLRNGFYFPVIMIASTNCDIADPDLIVSGSKLKIIDLKKNLNNPAARQAIKDSLKDVARIYHEKHKPWEEAGLIKLAESL